MSETEWEIVAYSTALQMGLVGFSCINPELIWPAAIWVAVGVAGMVWRWIWPLLRRGRS